MISIDKTNLNLKYPMDSMEVERAVKVAGTNLNEDWILSYDTKTEIVYHSTNEINKAMARLSSGYIKEFNRVYAINQDIHDCIEDGIVEIITLEVMKEVCSHSQPLKYFMTLNDYVEANLVGNFMELQILYLSFVV